MAQYFWNIVPFSLAIVILTSPVFVQFVDQDLSQSSTINVPPQANVSGAECVVLNQSQPLGTYLPSEVPHLFCQCRSVSSHDPPSCPSWISTKQLFGVAITQEKNETICTSFTEGIFFPRGSIPGEGKLQVLLRCRLMLASFLSPKYIINIERSGNEGRCNDDNDCYIEEQSCVNSVCSCPNDKPVFNYPNRCFTRVSLLGEQCQKDFQCNNSDSHSYCSISSTCECKPYYEENNHNCEAISKTSSTLEIVIYACLTTVVFLCALAIAFKMCKSLRSRSTPGRDGTTAGQNFKILAFTSPVQTVPDYQPLFK